MDWSDISINKFQKIYEAQQEGGEDMLFKVLAIVEGKTLDDILNTPMSKLEGLMKDIQFLYSEPRVPFVKFKFDLNGSKYKIWMKPTEMSVAQYIDFTTLAPKYTTNLSQFLSTVVIPEGHKYNDGYDLDKAIKDIGEYMPVTDGLAVAGFFLTWFETYAHLSLKSSIRKLKVLVRREKNPELKQKYQELLTEVQRLRS